MTTPNYEYYGLMVKYWDLLRGDTSTWSDRFFYLDVIKKYGQPVLDIGCGAGRLLIDYLSQGIDIDGVDNSPEMIALCRENAEKKGLKPNLYIQSMTELQLPRKYKTILVPSSSMQLYSNRVCHCKPCSVSMIILNPAVCLPYLSWLSGEKVLHSKVNSRRKRRDRKRGRRSVEVAGIASTLRQTWKTRATHGKSSRMDR